MILLNIIILLLIAHLFVQFLFKPSRGILNCGLFGFSSTKAGNWNQLKKFKFEMLGVDMDARGGDGCGVAFDNEVIKSAEIKKFDDFWRTGVVPDKLKKSMIIGHDRKASIGEKTFENTQPICFNFQETKTAAILAHNGTIWNHKELYEKHKLELHYDETDIKTMSDSQVLALLLERVGWSILEEYTGSVAMMLMMSSDPDGFYVYHGKSSLRKFAMASEERPLFFAIDGDDIWFCSTRVALEKIISVKSSIQEVPFNEVLRVSGNTMTKVIDIDREKAFQMEEVKTPMALASRYHSDSEYGDGYDGYSQGWNKWSGGSQSKKPASDQKLSADIAYGKYQNIIYWEAGCFKVAMNALPKYTDKGQILNGLIYMTMAGKLVDKGYAATGIQSYGMYFWQGNLCKGRDEYQECLMLDNAFSNTVSAAQLMKLTGGNFAFPFLVPKVIGGDDDILFSNVTCSALCVGEKMYDYYNIPYSGAIAPTGRSQKLIFRQGQLSDLYQETYNGYYDLKCFSDMYPEEFEEWLYSFTAMTKAGPIVQIEDEDFQYPCPECECTGEHISGSMCEYCEGSGFIPKEKILEELKDISSRVDILSVRCEEMKYASTILDITEDGIALFEEPDMLEKSNRMLGKLKQIKSIIEE